MALKKSLVLLVDDSKEDVELTIMALEESNPDIDVVIARSGQAALDYLFGMGAHAGRDIRAMPKVILLDLKMPKMDVIDVLNRIRADARTSHLPVVILTTSDEESDKAASYAGHANSYIRKPVDFEAFGAAIRQVGLYWHGLNEVS